MLSLDENEKEENERKDSLEKKLCRQKLTELSDLQKMKWEGQESMKTILKNLNKEI